MAVTSQSTSPSGNDPVISVRHLAKEFHLGASLFSKKREQVVSAVADVSFDVERGRTLGIVGESGCGKSTTARCILRLVEPTSGEIHYRKLSPTDQTIEEIDLGQASESELRRFRSDLQIVFQDPVASFNPRMTVGASVSEPLVVNTDLTRDEREGRTQELLELVGLESGHSQRYPHEFSGGQRQRIGVARALALNRPRGGTRSVSPQVRILGRIAVPAPILRVRVLEGAPGTRTSGLVYDTAIRGGGPS